MVESSSASRPQHIRPKVLKVGLMCRSTVLERWKAEAVRHVLGVSGVQISLLIVEDPKDSAEEAQRNPGLRRFKTTARYSIWRLYQSIRQSAHPLPWKLPVDLARDLVGVPTIKIEPKSEGPGSPSLSKEVIQNIIAHDLDLILSFGPNTARGEILGIPRYGVWSFHHDDNPALGGTLDGFWETYRGEKTYPGTLLRLTEEEDDGLVIRQEHFATVMHSFGQNLSQLYMGSVEWPAHACRALLAGDGDGIFLDAFPVHRANDRTPRNWQMLVFLYRLAKRLIRKQVADLFGGSYSSVSNWAIGIVEEPAADLIRDCRGSTVNWYQPPEGRYFADPFAVVRDGRTYIFFEDYDYKLKKGRISVAERDDLPTFGEARTVLEQQFHLSYPYIIEHDGRHFMIPEQAQSREVVLYESEDFPDGWVQRTILLHDFPGVDPTVFQHDGQWWMFVGNEDNDPETNLYLFYSTGLLGPWQPHPNNPVKSETQLARSGGTPFVADGLLLRPAQDGSRTYGGQLVINEITTLTKSKFEEKFHSYLTPNPAWDYPDGLHTLADAGDITVIDGKRFLVTRDKFSKVMAAKARTLRRSLSRIPSGFWRGS